MNQSMLIPVLIAVLVVARFLFRELRERKIPLARAYVVPGFLLLIACYLAVTTLAIAPGRAPVLAFETLVALLLGSAVGLAVGHFTTVRLGQLPRVAYVRGSFVTVAIWIAALALRLLARLAMPMHDPGAIAAANAALVFMLAAALGMVRYRVVLQAKRAQLQGTTQPVAAV